MSSKKKLQGGRKEAPLEVVGSNDVAPSQDTSPTTEEKEQQSYRDLLNGFFEKLTRWQEIHEDKKYHRNSDDKFSDFEVLQTSQGLTISPLNENSPLEKDAKWGKVPPNRVLVMTRAINIDDPERHVFNREFIVRPGQAGEHLLVDSEGRPLNKIEIKVAGHKLARLNSLIISTEYAQYTNTMEDRYKGVDYGQIKISRYLWFPLMSDEYATHLFNTIDALIPGSTSPIQQPERRASKETPISKALLSARRKLGL